MTKRAPRWVTNDGSLSINQTTIDEILKRGEVKLWQSDDARVVRILWPGVLGWETYTLAE